MRIEQSKASYVLCAPGMSCDQIQIVIGVQESHVFFLNAAVYDIQKTGSRNPFNFHPETLKDSYKTFIRR